tara:strand:+ start:364 stop:972 length:609 start_codon:yes stop_codon:yes gene_type:complete
MRSLNEIDTTAKRASKAMGFSWGISEEIGKNIRLLELFGLPGIKSLNSYFKVYKSKSFQNISLISKLNVSKIPYCPIISGVTFLDQITILEELNEIDFQNIAFPILFIPFLSRSSEIIGKKILLKLDEKKFLLNFNQSIYSNYNSEETFEKADKINIKFINNKNLFSENEWENLYKLSEETFVEETEELKQKAAGAGLRDND